MYVADELRELAGAIPEEEDKPSEFWDSTKETNFEKVSISRLLRFVADMYE